MSKKSFSKKMILPSVLTAAICGTCFFNTTVFAKDTSNISASNAINCFASNSLRGPAGPTVVYKNIDINIISPDTVAVGENVNFISDLDIPGSDRPNLDRFGKSYSWDFGDGTTSWSPSPTHSFKAPGVYTITLNAKATFQNCQPYPGTQRITYKGSTTKTIIVK